MATEVEEPRTDADQPELEQEEQEGGPVKTFLEHLEDLRWVLIKSLVAIAVGMFLCLISGNYVMQILERPLRKATRSYPGTNQVWTVRFGTNRLGTFLLPSAMQERMAIGTNRYVALHIEPVPVGTNLLLGLRLDPTASAVQAQPLGVDLVNLSPVGAFVVALQVALYGGFVVAAPFVFFFVAGFVFPALRKIEKHYVFRGLGFSVGLFFAGVAFTYFFLMPLALGASVKYSNWFGFSASQWRAEDYISFCCKFMLGMGIGFQMPVVLLTLVKIGVLSYSTLAKMRRYMIVINLVLGAVLTTPEVITQVLMAIPLQVLYEISVWIAWWWERKDRKRAEQEAAAQAAEGVKRET
jgi:sec-independent protein translocase protein TatC